MPKSPALSRASLKRLKVKRLSHGAANSGNVLIKGDNVRILEALQPTYGDTIRCVYIDPPYNNQESYNHYIDELDHEEWLDGLRDRLRLLFPLLTSNGSIWISIDDREAHYLKVACDDLFGRDKFVATMVWQHRKSRENRRVFSPNHEYLLVYARCPGSFKTSRNLLPFTDEVLLRFKNPDSDPRGPWQSVSVNVQDGHATPQQFYTIVAPSGRCHRPPKGRCWVYSEPKMKREILKNNIWFGNDGNGVPRRKVFLRDSRSGLTPPTLWTAEDVGTTKDAKKEILTLFPNEKPFDTPKPESLIRRIVEIATDPGDFVLDAYLGSGTTTAVAHKLGRKYIGIESGEHAITHCAERLRAVVEGEQGGISEAVGWRGGGGFSFVEFDSRRGSNKRPTASARAARV